jgi:tetratricopeptide (TPR) repeat protein
LGISQALCGFFPEAITYLERTLELSTGTDDLPTRYIPHGGLGYVYWQIGDIAQAQKHTARSLELAAEGGAQALIQLPLFQCIQAEILAHAGNFDAAVALAEKALTLAQDTRQDFSKALAQQHLSCILLTARRPKWQRAEELLQEAIAFMKQGSGRLSAAVAMLDLVKLYQAQGRQRQAQALLPEAQAIFAEAGVDWYLQQLEQLAGNKFI